MDREETIEEYTKRRRAERKAEADRTETAREAMRVKMREAIQADQPISAMAADLGITTETFLRAASGGRIHEGSWALIERGWGRFEEYLKR